jgi:hypothetical protein
MTQRHRWCWGAPFPLRPTSLERVQRGWCLSGRVLGVVVFPVSELCVATLSEVLGNCGTSSRRRIASAACQFGAGNGSLFRSCFSAMG